MTWQVDCKYIYICTYIFLLVEQSHWRGITKEITGAYGTELTHFFFNFLYIILFQLLLHMVFTSRNWFAMQGPVAIILISWNVIQVWETYYPTEG